MNHRGASWLLGMTVLQLVACDHTRPGGDEPEEHRSARPARAADGAISDEPSGSPDVAPPADSAGVVPRQQPDVAEAAPDSEPVIPPDPIVTADTGYEAARCGGAATRRMSIVGNLDASTHAPWFFEGPFSPQSPAATSNFSTTIAGFDDLARWQLLCVYFKRVEQGWDYHVLMEGTSYVLGQGHLSFDEQGSATVVATQELRLLTATGPGHAVELDLGGMTQLALPSNIASQEVDGAEARWGNQCVSSEPLPDGPAVTGSWSCPAVATKRLTLRANLAAAAPIVAEPWDPLAPRAELTSFLQGNDADGTPIDFVLRLRKAGADTWDYNVSLWGEVSDLEVANGSLRFNPNGSLDSVTTTRPLRFPNRNGMLGDLIELDFGIGTAVGGNGVDGITSLPGASFEVWQQGDGVTLDCLPPSSPPYPLVHSPGCAGERTTGVWPRFNLDHATPISDTTSYSASVTVYDAALQPHQLDFNFRHVEDGYWQCQLLAGSLELGVVDLYFYANGVPERADNIPTLRLPLADGSEGPPIQVAFDDYWAITAFAIESGGSLVANGAAPSSEGCVE